MARRTTLEVANTPPLDLSALVGEVKPTTVRTGRNRFGGPSNPYIPIVRETFEEDTKETGSGWRENTLQAGQVREFVAALRNAATFLKDENIGIRIKFEFRSDEDGEFQGRVIETGDITKVPSDDRPVAVKYTGRTKKQYGANDEEPEEDEDDATEDVEDDED
jgi:hypothetical protein